MEENTQPQVNQAVATPPKPELPEHLVTQLRTLVDPEIGLDVIALGLIRAVREKNDSAEVDMMLTTPFCPYGGWMIQQVKQISEQALNKSVEVKMLSDLWDPNYMEDPGLLTGW